MEFVKLATAVIQIEVVMWIPWTGVLSTEMAVLLLEQVLQGHGQGLVLF